MTQEQRLLTEFFAVWGPQLEDADSEINSRMLRQHLTALYAQWKQIQTEMNNS